MKLRRVFVGSASVLALACLAAPALAQESMETVVVTGIRASMQRAMDIKRDASTIVDAVSAEDIGKFPDKNIADALQRVPGVNTVSAAGGEGGFDENDRVSIRGTNPSLTDVQVDGHKVSTGDWFILDQSGTVGRSVSLTLLPSEIVSNLKVYKSQQADLVEGGVAGVVNVITRKPLDLKSTFTLQVSGGAAYTTLRGDTTPQFNALAGYRDDSGKFGVIVQAFYEARNTRRDGQEILGYSSVSSTSPFGLAHPTAVNAQYPNLIGSALFMQQRIREGGMVTAQFQPTDSFEFDLQGFYSKLKASNINNNYMFFGSNEFPNNVPTAYTIGAGNVITSATFPAAGGTPIVADSIMRPGSGSDSYYFNAHGSWDPSANLNVSVQGGVTRGTGNTSPQVAWEGVVNAATAASYQITPTGITTVSVPGVNLADPSTLSNNGGWAWTVVGKSADREYYGQIDTTYKTTLGPINSFKAGFRYSDHHHEGGQWNKGTTVQTAAFNSSAPASAWTTGAAISAGNYPSDFADSFKIPGMLTNLPLGDTSKIENLLFNNGANNGAGYALTPANVQDPKNHRFDWTSSMYMSEFDTAMYAMATMGGEGWNGNFGVRLVNTREDIEEYHAEAFGLPSDWGTYGWVQHVHSYWDVLPSVNVSINLTQDQYLRFAAAETMARPDYSALGSAVSLTDLILTGSGGNPDLKPIRSANYDISYEWYYGPRAMFAITGFYMDLASYVGFGTHQATYLNMQKTNGDNAHPVYSVYNITSPVNSSGHSEGVEIQWEQPIWGGFGVQTNLTYADGVDNQGGPLVGDSKVTANLTAYYENEWLSARLSYDYRSKMLIGLDRSTNEYQSPGDSLNGSLQVTFTDNLSATIDALNIANRKLRYTQGSFEPRAIYDNGRQFYFNLRYKL